MRSLSREDSTQSVESLRQSYLFIPEDLTPLYYAPVYRTLTQPQRIRYNQLFGLFLNEFVLLCELHFSKAYSSLLRAPHLSTLRRAEIKRFLEDEARHTELFTKLNQQAAPELYQQSGFHFIRLPRPLHLAASVMMRFPRLFPFFFLLVYLQEEKLVHYSDRYAASADRVDPRFLSVYATHLEDEKGHIGLDLSVVAELWQRASKPVRRLNAWLMRVIFREFFTAPKRSGMRIIEQLVKEFPELQGKSTSLKEGLVAAGVGQGFLAQMYSYESVPSSLHFFEQHPELQALTRLSR